MRIRKFFVFFLTITFILSIHTTVTHAESIDQKFIDIHNNYWAKDEVTQLVGLEIINGYPDLHFRPSVDVSRGQAANLLTSALKLPDSPYQPIFTDISAKSSHLKGVMATYNAGIFNGKPDKTFGAGDTLTREQMASVIARAFELENTGEEITFKDDSKISASHKEGVTLLAQHKITTGKEDGTFDPKSGVNRGTFVVFLHRAMVATGKIKPLTDVTFNEADTNGKMETVREIQNIVEVPLSTDNKTYIRSKYDLKYLGESTTEYGYATDTVYTYRVVNTKATLEITRRDLPNNDYLVFTSLINNSSTPVQLDLLMKTSSIESSKLISYDRFPIKKNEDDTFGFDPTTYPKGIVENKTVSNDVYQTMFSKLYRSKQLTLTYSDKAKSVTRDLRAEVDVFSNIQLGDAQLTVIPLKSLGSDIVDYWFMKSNELLFKTRASMDSWMLESAVNYRKRNSWYTATGPYNKMAVTVEPMPSSFNGFGRNLLMVKEDRILKLYEANKERYFENLLINSFVNLQLFKGDKNYWETEVTSTYLKSLYGITAPFVDTRFNEQIALFLYKSGQEFGHDNYNEALRNYANLLTTQKSKGNYIPVDGNSYYISDYFPVAQNVTTHSSMNHVLGGMNILLTAYKEFGDVKYLTTATSIQTAINKEKNLWIRPDHDIWYKVSPKKEFVGRDYNHLTLEDLINSYTLWQDIDPSHLPVIKDLIISKATYLDQNQLGYTIKIKEGFERLGILDLLPRGPQYTDAN